MSDTLERQLQKSLTSSLGKAAETTALRQKRLPFLRFAGPCLMAGSLLSERGRLGRLSECLD
jgi:hypothetical protein